MSLFLHLRVILKYSGLVKENRYLFDRVNNLTLRLELGLGLQVRTFLTSRIRFLVEKKNAILSFLIYRTLKLWTSWTKEKVPLLT